jgi:DNA modification methylase
VGSGTTAAVCRRLGRRFVALDISPEAIALTRWRLATAAVA